MSGAVLKESGIRFGYVKSEVSIRHQVEIACRQMDKQVLDPG